MNRELAREREEGSAYLSLADKERAFVDLYVGEAHLNGAEAARLLGYKEAGSDWVASHRMLSRDKVRAAIEERLTAGLQMQADECMIRLAAIARQDAGQYLTIKHEEGCASLYHEQDECDCTPDVRVNLGKRTANLTLVQEVGRDRQGNITLKLPSRVEALALIARRHALLTDRQVQSTQEVYDVEWTTPAVAQEGTILEETDTPSPNVELTDTPALPAGEASDASE